MKRPQAAFSLVEVAVAIGIFAFVAVGILGLLPTAMKMRAASAQETRATMIAQELFSSIAATGSLMTSSLRDGPGLQSNNNQIIDLTDEIVVLGYPPNTTVPYGLWSSDRGNDPQEVWETGQLPGWAVQNGIQTLARLSATNFPTSWSTNLYKVTCEVRTPASLPLENSRPAVFSTYMSR